MNDANGATFRATFFSTDTVDKVNFRFHYSDQTAGGWSGTVQGSPTPFAKTVTTVTLTPALSLALSTDHTTAIPGDTISYTATVTNTGSTLAVGGDFVASATGSGTATVVSYWDDIATSADGTTWAPLAGSAAAQSGYTPGVAPPITTGMTLSPTSVAATGVTYPSSGDRILGTTIGPGDTATWHYAATVPLAPAQAAALVDPTKTEKVRNSFHLEVSPANPNVTQPAIVNVDYSNLFFGAGPSASLSNVQVSIQPPQNAAPLVFNSTNTPPLATLAPGASAAVTGTFKVPVPAAKGSQTDAAYFASLSAVEGMVLTASATAGGTAPTGTVTAAPPPNVSATEHLPIVSIKKSGPAQLNAGDTETNPLTLLNNGGATAASLSVVDAVAGGGSGTVSGVPPSLAAGASSSASATYPVPTNQPSGSLTDTASVSWTDANGNAYGSLSSSFTTQVLNILSGATLTLAPTSAGPIAPGTNQLLTATLLDSHGNPIPNQLVHFTVNGVNPGSGTATTDLNGNAQFTYAGANAGTDFVQATVTGPGITLNSNQSNVTWLRQLQPVSMTMVQGNFYRNDLDQNDPAACTFGVGPGSTPVFSQNFPNIMFNPDPGVFKNPAPFIPANNNFTRPFTDVTTDVNGNPNGRIVAQGNGVAAGSDMINFYADFTGTFVVNAPGDLTFRILHDDGYILGVGGAATRVSGDRNNDPATTPFNNYPVMAAWNTTSTGSSSSGPATVHFPAAGIYPYELDYTECKAGPLFLDLLTEQFVAQTSPLSVYVGYADGLRAGGSIFPFPWNGSPNTTFEGCTGCTYDGGAIRLDNSGTTPIQIDSVTVDIPMAPGVTYCPTSTHFDIWPHNLTVPAGQTLILAPMANGSSCGPPDTFDTSDTSFYCGTDTGVIPLVNLTSGGVTTTFRDSTQVLNTGGKDVGVCTGNESESWQRIGGGGTSIDLPVPPAAILNLTPFNVPGAIQGQAITLTVAALDGAGNPAANLPVTMQVSGANTQSQTKSTDIGGLVSFTYTGAAAGTDTVEATAFVEGLRSISNVGNVVWIPPGGTNNPLGPSITATTPGDGAVVSKPVPVDATIAPLPGHSITSWRVFFQAANGGPPVVIPTPPGPPPSPLGVTFDPTLLADGAYTLTVEATGDNGVTQDVSSGISVVGSLKLGRYKTTFNDLTVPVDGFQMQVLRTYDSTDTSTGDFGVGWRVDVSNFRVSGNRSLGAGGWTQYNKSCVLGLCFTGFKNPAPRFVTVVYPDQRTEIFDFVPNGGTNVFWTCTPVFKARASTGATSTLVPLDDTSCSYNGDGNLYGANGPYDPHRFQLTTRSGQVFILDHNVGLISVTDRNSNHLTVDSTGIHSSSGQSISYTRDGSGRIMKIVGPSGQTLQYTYSSSGDLATSTSPNGALTSYSYDGSHHLLGTSGPGSPLRTFHYDPSGRLTAITDGAGNTTQVSSNVTGQQETVIDPSGRLTTVNTYDDLGDATRIDRIADGTTLTTTMTYDAAGHMLSIANAGGGVTTATYDAAGQMTSITDPAGITTHYAYDSLGNVISATGPGGVAMVAMTYDGSGNLLTVTDGAGNTTTYTYDTAGNPTSRTGADGRSASYTFTSNGILASSTTAAGVSTFTSDASGRITGGSDANGHTTTLTYDADGNLLSVTDGGGHTRSWTYDSLDRLLTSTNANGGHSTLVYDAAGNLASVTDANGMTVTRTYDADGRLVGASAPDGSSATFAYDGFGRMVSAVSPAASLGFTYDSRGYLLTQVTAGAQPANTLTYAYDADGRRTSSAGPDGTIAYAYGPQSNLVSVTDAAGGVFSYGYDAAFNLTTLQRPDGVVDTNTYDPAGHLLSRSSAKSGTVLAFDTYAYNSLGERASRVDAANTATYQFDPVAQLISVGNSSPSVPSEAYTYDAAGNRTSSGGATVTYDSGGRMVSQGGTTFTYDAQGQRTSSTDAAGNLTTYSWNAFHQLVGVSPPVGSPLRYSYDALGRRVEADQGTSATHFTYDVQNLRLQYSGGALTSAYTYPPFTGGPLEVRQGSAAYYYLSDAQGSTVGLADQAGGLVATQRYDSFGNPVSSTGSVANSLTYLGEQYDAGSGLYFLNARYYDPRTGSFLSQDPMPNVNRYAYSLNDPVDLSDPSGAVNDYEIQIVTEEKNIVALDNATAPQTSLAVQGTLREAVQASIEADAEPLAAAGDQGDALAIYLKIVLILYQKELTIGVAVALVFATIIFAALLIAYICSQINDAMPDPTTSTGTPVASGARRTSTAERLCTGLPGG